jgi:hypothetical protein
MRRAYTRAIEPTGKPASVGYQGKRRQVMNETMQETMKREQEEMLATLTRANSALSRIFNMEEKEGDNE